MEDSEWEKRYSSRGDNMMAWDNRSMISEVFYHSGPEPLTMRQIIGAVRTMFAVRLTRRDVRLACFATPEFKRAGSSAYRLDDGLHADRLVRELLAA
jgi:hypothetical protein